MPFHYNAVGVLTSAGRVLLGGLFVVAGFHHLSMLPRMVDALHARGVPFPRLSLAMATAFQITAGVLLMLGLLVPPAALGLVVFTFSASVTRMNFWDLEGVMRDAAIRGWQSNLAIIGGLLIAAAQAL
jgi:putative oxidoreductase